MKATLSIAGTNFGAGEEIRGIAEWSGPSAPRGVELRLFWRTEGKGTSDVSTVWETNFDRPQIEDRREFALAAPDFPPSFSGRLISLVWAFELVIDGKGISTQDLVIAPGGVEVNIQQEGWLAMEAPWELKKPKWFQRRW